MGASDTTDIVRFPSGSYVIDTITGGGIPEGRIIEMSGKESSGKTTVALQTVASVQKMGRKCSLY